MKKFIKLTSLACSLILMLSAAACSDNKTEDSSSASSTKSSSPTFEANQPVTASERSLAATEEFDADKAFKNIQLGGKMLPSPFCFADLDNNFSIGMKIFDGEDDAESGKLIGNILCNGSTAVSYNIYIKNADQKDDKKFSNTKFDVIMQEKDDAMNSGALLTILGIGVGDSMDDVDKALGIPESRSMSGGNSGSYTYMSENDTSRKITIDFEENTVTRINIFYSVLSSE